jgi:putative spermidine/putrescine transport system substrate-binding protein
MSARRGIGKVAFAVTLLISLAACASGGKVATTPAATSSSKIGGTLTLNSSGGAVFDVWRKSWWAPFTNKTGVVVSESSPNDFAKLKLAVDSHNVEWNLVEVSTGAQFQQAIAEGLSEKIDQTKLRKYFESFGGKWSDLLPGTLNDYGVWDTAYSTVLIYDKRVFKDKAPTSVKDLWNVKEFPGKRCINGSAMYSLEQGAYANGASLTNIYPIDTTAAIAKIAALRPYISKFWSSGAEPIQLVSSGACVMSTAWNGRPFAAKVVDGIDYLGTVWDGAILHKGYWVIPKGAADQEAAYAGLAYYMLPEVGAASADSTAYPNSNAATMALVKPATLPFLATNAANLSHEIVQDDAWWYKNGPAAEEQYAAMQLKK